MTSAARSNRNEIANIPDGAFLEAFQHLVGEIFRINGQLLATADNLLRDLDLTPARWQTIAVISRQPLTASQISRQLGIKRQSVQPTVNRLKEKGIVRLIPNPGHKRSPLVELTATGQKIWTQLLEKQQQLTSEFTGNSKLTAEDLERLTIQLRTLREHANNQEKED